MADNSLCPQPCLAEEEFFLGLGLWPCQDGDQSLRNKVAKDKGEGKKTKPSSETKDVAKIQDDAIKAREAEAKDVPSFQPSKKEVPLPLAKTQSRCRSHQIFGVTKSGSYLATYIMCAQR